jgi:hypothetical protein
VLISALIVATNLFQSIEMAPVGRCIPGPHGQLRVRKHPFMP